MRAFSSIKKQGQLNQFVVRYFQPNEKSLKKVEVVVPVSSFFNHTYISALCCVYCYQYFKNVIFNNEYHIITNTACKSD